jgi:hypothetical protein
MKITIRGTTDSLDPNNTCNNPEQSLANYNAELDAAILAEYPDAEIIHENMDDCSGIIVVGQTEDERRAEDEIRDFVQRAGEDIYAAGNFWEPPFQLSRTVSSTGPIYRGEYQAWRIEAAADLNSFQVINDDSDCDTFERDGEDFAEKSSAGVTDDWSEDDFKTVIDEINRLQK